MKKINFYLKMYKNFLKASISDQSGIVLVTALLIMLVLTLLGTAAIMTTSTDVKISANFKRHTDAFYIAQAGVEAGRDYLKTNFDSTTGWNGFLATPANCDPCSYSDLEDLDNKNNITSTYTSTDATLNQVGNGSFNLYTVDDDDGDSDYTADDNQRIYITAKGIITGAASSVVVLEEYIQFFQGYDSYGGKDLTVGGTSVAEGEATW